MLVAEVVGDVVAVVVVVAVEVAVDVAVVVVPVVVPVVVGEDVADVVAVLVAVEVPVVEGEVVGVVKAHPAKEPSAKEPTALLSTETTSSQFVSSRTKPLAVHLIDESTSSVMAYPSTTAFSCDDALQLPDTSLTNVLPLAEAQPRLISSPVQSSTASLSFAIWTSHRAEATLRYVLPENSRHSK